ncbi:Unknown protein, partial [Striga hermonthica]
GLNIHLKNLIIHMSGHNQENPDGFEHGYRRKGFLIIDPFFLSVPFRNKPSFEGLNLPIWSSLSLIDPLASNGAYATGWLCKIPDLISVHRLYFRFHRLLPRLCVLILDCLIVCPWVGFKNVWDGLRRLSQTHEP